MVIGAGERATDGVFFRSIVLIVIYLFKSIIIQYLIFE